MRSPKVIKRPLVIGLLASVLMLLYFGFRRPEPISVTLVNHSECTFLVKVNHVPSHVFGVTSEGPLISLQPDTIVVLELPSQKDGTLYHVPAFGVNKERGSRPPVVVGSNGTLLKESMCNYFPCTPCVVYEGSPASPMLVVE